MADLTRLFRAIEDAITCQQKGPDMACPICTFNLRAEYELIVGELPSIVSDDNTYKPLTDAELLDIWMGTTSTEEPPFKVSKLTRRLVAELRAWRKMALSSDKASKEVPAK